MSLTILLVRHGSHDEVGHVLSGRSNIGLNIHGAASVRRLAARLSGASIGKICTSPRRRARETAEIVADRHGLDCITEDGLDEIDFGAWSGRTFAELDSDAEWRAWNTARGRASTPGGETMTSVTTRALRSLQTCEGAGTAVCVSHCDVIRGLVAHFLGLDHDRILSFDIDPASVTTIRSDASSTKVVAVNERVS